MKGCVIAGTESGVGKTTVALAIMAALRQRGVAVQAFKCGPDFLDTGHHTQVCGRASRNLDTWMLDSKQCQNVFANAAMDADVAIVEGVMGLFDGASGTSETGSTAEIAKLLNLPVILVVDAAKAARSIAAVVRGFEGFDPELRLLGVVLNRVAGAAHFRLLDESIQASCRTPILGWLPPEPTISIPERHLGLRSAVEQGESGEKIRALATFAERHLHMDRLVQSMPEIWPKASPVPAAIRCGTSSPVRIAVALDAAFQFYYADNFDLLRQCGAEIVFFSPLADHALPQNTDALYLGGGYPEIHAGQLTRNQSMLEDVRAFAGLNKPIYAECGGMMYLSRELRTSEGQLFEMAGLLPFTAEMTERLVRFGYAKVEFTRDCLLGKRGTTARGHSFHYSRLVSLSVVETAYQVEYSLSGKSEPEGYTQGGLLASYIHLNFRTNPELAEALVSSIRESRDFTAGAR